MGITKWFLKHGPGVGGYAKAMVKSYINIKKANPQASEKELFYLLIKSRIDAHTAHGQKVIIDEHTQKKIVRESFGSLSHLLIDLLYEIEPKWIFASRNFRMEAFKVIEEIVDEYGLERDPDFDFEDDDGLEDEYL